MLISLWPLAAAKRNEIKPRKKKIAKISSRAPIRAALERLICKEEWKKTNDELPNKVYKHHSRHLSFFRKKK